MPQILVPGTAQAVLKGTVSGHPFANIFHYQLGTTGIPWTQAQLQALTDGIMSGIAQTGGIGVNSAQGVVFQQVVAVDLSTGTPAEAVSTHAAVVGTQLPEPTPSTCVLVDNIITARYRGGHPRSYMPPMGATSLTSNEDSWTTAAVAAYQTGYTNMHDAAFSAVPGIHQVAVRYNYTYTDDPIKHKWIKTRSSLNSTPQVINYLVKSAIGTQRRRARIGG